MVSLEERAQILLICIMAACRNEGEGCPLKEYRIYHCMGPNLFIWLHVSEILGLNMLNLL